MTRTTISAGQPDDDNRDYLPPALKGSDIVVNENGNNSQPYPPRLQQHSGVIADGVTDTWYTYVPESYDPAVPVPLVVSLHGGLMEGWAQAVYTSWTNVADREGFIVVFPTASSRKLWMIDIAPQWTAAMTAPNPSGLYLHEPPASVDENHDILFVLGLIELMASTFSIDRGRVFLQGMSMGDLMSSHIGRNTGQVLAGLAGSGGPTDPELLFTADGAPINRSGPLPVWQSRLDLDNEPTLFSDDTPGVVVANREYWLGINGVTENPAIAIRGVDNFAFYRGAHADVVFRDVRNRDHGQTFDDAELVWDYFFSGLRRAEDGSSVQSAPAIERTGDRFAVAIAEGRAHGWVSGNRVPLSTAVFEWHAAKYHGMGGEAIVRATPLYATLSFVASAFGATLTTPPDGLTGTLTLQDGRVVEFARGVIGCVLDGRITAMTAEAVLRDGELCIPLEWFAASVLDLHTSTHSGVLYVTDHHAQLSENMARLLSDLLA